MVREQNRGNQRRLSGAMIILRDGLIFVLCVLLLLAVRIVPQKIKSIALSRQASYSQSAQSAVSPQTPSPSGEQATLATDAAQNGELSSAAAETPLQPTPEASSANGDFSATFPTTDTGAGALYRYQTDTIRIAINRLQSNGATYFVADVWVRNIEAFRTALAKNAYGRNLHELPLKIAKDNAAVFAVSGDYYGAREDGLVVRNGVLYRDVMSDDVCILKKDGTLNVYKKGTFSVLSDVGDSTWQAWAFGPALVEDGVACNTSSSKIKVKNPRCAIGYYEPGHYCFIVADGRQDGYSDGMTLEELADTFVSLGCKTAYNLDGGATAMMVFDGAVINQPTKGGRASSDIIYF